MSATAAQSAIKERPILFSGPMVRAILEGRKTQTRRVIKLPPAPNHLGTWEGTTVGGEGSYLDKAHTQPAPELSAIWHTRTGHCIASPCQVGNRLWVRETFGVFDDSTLTNRDLSDIYYRADDETKYESDGIWRPSIFMPRWASRITLEITNVRVERLQEITEKDAKAEGATPANAGQDEHGPIKTYRTGFVYGWNSINGKRKGCAWSDNPWVWVITFKPLEASA